MVYKVHPDSTLLSSLLCSISISFAILSILIFSTRSSYASSFWTSIFSVRLRGSSDCTNNLLLAIIVLGSLTSPILLGTPLFSSYIKISPFFYYYFAGGSFLASLEGLRPIDASNLIIYYFLPSNKMR